MSQIWWCFICFSTWIHSDGRLQLYAIFKASVKHGDTHDISISRRHTAAVSPLNFRMRNWCMGAINRCVLWHKWKSSNDFEVYTFINLPQALWSINSHTLLRTGPTMFFLFFFKLFLDFFLALAPHSPLMTVGHTSLVMSKLWQGCDLSCCLIICWKMPTAK